MKYLPGLIFILIIANIVLSIFAVYQEYNGFSFCITGKGCEKVQNSEYSSILGIKLGWLGTLAFTALLIIYYLTYNKKLTQKLYISAISLGAILAIYFIYLQLFVIKAICSTCITLDFITIIISIASFKALSADNLTL